MADKSEEIETVIVDFVTVETYGMKSKIGRFKVKNGSSRRYRGRERDVWSKVVLSQLSILLTK